MAEFDKDLFIERRVVNDGAFDEVSLSRQTIDIGAIVNGARSPRYNTVHVRLGPRSLPYVVDSDFLHRFLQCWGGVYVLWNDEGHL
jgi:hypothetical protein